MSQEERQADSLLGIVLRAKMPADTDPDAEATITLTPGLPLYRVTTSAGLSDEDEAAQVLRANVYMWTGLVAEKLATYDPQERAALARVLDRPPPGVEARDWTPERARRLLLVLKNPAGTRRMPALPRHLGGSPPPDRSKPRGNGSSWGFLPLDAVGIGFQAFVNVIVTPSLR
jgi:hypothetical protein